VKILIVHPGASWSIHDVWRGLTGAFERQNVELVHYAMNGRLQESAMFLSQLNRQLLRNNPRSPTFGAADYLYHASIGALERALRHEVDWVFFVSGLYFHMQVFSLLRKANVKMAVLLTESPYADEHEQSVASLVDVVFTNERTSLDTFRPMCHSVHYYQHAYDPAVHYPSEDRNEAIGSHDVIFVGTGFQERCDLLSAVDWSGIDLGLYGSWGLLGSRNTLRRSLINEVVPNELTTQLYRQAKIGLNIHRTSIGYGRDVPRITGAESMNPRCYELAASGTFFITDNRPEVKEVFGSAVPTFDGPEELEAQIHYWLTHDEERLAIAAALPELVRPHTFDQRVSGIIDVLAHFR